jgi:hypothetical protein
MYGPLCMSNMETGQTTIGLISDSIGFSSTFILELSDI